ncbi:hypothetical protein N7497_009519 [Penicillium chrysogenum]|nr:hypothetical protein N7524_007573 [Penicillium chrysogenum]KAJ6147537.1 hypothetical protein N7497_009519 [Penicillium chrysogenum]
METSLRFTSTVYIRCANERFHNVCQDLGRPDMFLLAIEGSNLFLINGAVHFRGVNGLLERSCQTKVLHSVAGVA